MNSGSVGRNQFVDATNAQTKMNTQPAPGHKRRSLRIGRVIVIWAINTVALMLLAWILQGFSIESWSSGLALAAVLGLLNALVWPVLIRVALPFTVITLGFGVLLLNGVFVWLASDILADSVQISGLWTADRRRDRPDAD